MMTVPVGAVIMVITVIPVFYTARHKKNTNSQQTGRQDVFYIHFHNYNLYRLQVQKPAMIKVLLFWIIKRVCYRLCRNFSPR